MMTIEDLKHCEHIYYNLDKLCYSYFEKNSYDFENYNGFDLDGGGNIVIHYWFINYLDEHDSGTKVVSFEDLIEFANNNI